MSRRAPWSVRSRSCRSRRRSCRERTWSDMAKATAELRDLDLGELVDKLAEAKAEAFNLRFQHATGQLDNTSRLPQLRREIARINTLLRQREIAAAEAQETS